MEKLTDEGEWRINKRRRIMKTAAEIVNNWTDNETSSFWLKDIEHIQEVRIIIHVPFICLTNVFYRNSRAQRKSSLI